MTNVLKHGAADDREGMVRVGVRKISVCIEIRIYDSREMPIDDAVPSGVVLGSHGRYPATCGPPGVRAISR